MWCTAVRFALVLYQLRLTKISGSLGLLSKWCHAIRIRSVLWYDDVKCKILVRHQTKMFPSALVSTAFTIIADNLLWNRVTSAKERVVIFRTLNLCNLKQGCCIDWLHGVLALSSWRARRSGQDSHRTINCENLIPN